MTQVIIASSDSQIAFDATISEQHKSTLTITEHPVEEGANVSDHAQKEPDDISINGIVSDTPIVLNVEDRQPSIPGGDPDNRAQQAFNEFQRLQDIAALLTVTTELRIYDNMMIQSIAVTKDKDRRHILDIGLTLREFRRAEVLATKAPEPSEPVHKPKGDGGDKPKKAPKKEVEEKQQSVAGKLINYFAGSG